MSSIEDLLIAKLSAEEHRLWAKSWAAVVGRAIGRAVLDSFDRETARLLRPIPAISDPAWRVRVMASQCNVSELCEAELIRHFSVLNVAVMEGVDSSGRPYRGRTQPRMRQHLRRIQAGLVSAPVSDAVLASLSPIDIWRATANELGRRVRGIVSERRQICESHIHNALLVAGYFRSCNLPDERLVTKELEDLSIPMLSLQGALVDIPEQISPLGISDERPPLAAQSGRFILHHRSLSPLLSVLANEAEMVYQGRGFLMRWLGTIRTATSRHVEPALMSRLRAVAYPKYEYSVLAFMALSAIEQLLRAVAQRLGLFEGQKRFTTSRLAQIAKALGDTVEVSDAISTVYDETRGNLRNRILHGAQLHIARAQRLAAISVGSPSLLQLPDALSPENVFFLCFDALRTLDARIAQVVSLTPADLEWTRHLELGSGEIGFGMRLQNDFSGEEGNHWLSRVDDFLTAVTPNVLILFDVGFLGWIDHQDSARLVKFMALNMVLEALFRVSVRITQGSILKWDVLASRDGALSFRYKMLDQHELCTPSMLDRLVESVDPPSRELAKRVLTLAVRARDAVAHGAVVDVVVQNAAMGNLLVKAIQCLVSASEHEMIKTAAYFQWQSHPVRDQATNWSEGQREILSEIKRTITDSEGGLVSLPTAARFALIE